MSTIVFGGGGFIGRDLVQRLGSDGREVVCADVAWTDAVAEAAACIECDVRDQDVVTDLVSRFEPDRVVNLASLLTAQTAERPRYATAVNSAGMANVLQASADHGVDRVLYASSIAAYGRPDDHGEVVTEDAPVPAAFTRYPVTLYAATKQFNEYLARFYAAEHGLTVAGVRPGVVFGPGRASGLAGWASSFVSAPARGEDAQIPLRPDQEMSMVYRDDVARLFAVLHDADAVEHAAYNTGGHRISVRDLAALIDDEFAGSVSWDEGGDPLGLVAGPSHERARSEFGFELTPLVDAVHDHAASAGEES
jgi:UDP-glucose 4-epimerase